MPTPVASVVVTESRAAHTSTLIELRALKERGFLYVNRSATKLF